MKHKNDHSSIPPSNNQTQNNLSEGISPIDPGSTSNIPLIGQLLKLGKQQGYLTYNQVCQGLGETDLESDFLDNLLELFENQDIELIEEAKPEKNKTVSISVLDIEKMVNLRKATKRLLQTLGRKLCTEELAAEVGFSVEETRRLLKLSRHPISLDRPAGESEDSFFGEFIEDDACESPVSAATQKMLQDKVDQVLKGLTGREREIIKLRYGLGDGYIYTLEEVSRIFKISRERVRQIEAKAIQKLEHPVRNGQLESFLNESLQRKD